MENRIKTALLAVDGFEEVEGLTAVDLLRRAGIVCDIVSVSDSDVIVGSHGIRIGADVGFSEADFDGCDALLLPGGRGTAALREDGRVLRLVQQFYGDGRLVAAICAAPTVLGRAGILSGKKATCYPGMEDQLTGAEVRTEKVVRDGNTITSRGLGTAVDFALAVIACLDSEEKAQAIAAKIVYAR